MSRMRTACRVGLAFVLAAVAAAAPPARADKATAKSPAKSVLPFVHDDYAKALGEARARKLPLFIETWAPW
jgi:hypothetical protein